MRILRPIVFSQALLMVAGKSEMTEGSAVGAQLVGRHPRRREALSSKGYQGFWSSTGSSKSSAGAKKSAQAGDDPDRQGKRMDDQGMALAAFLDASCGS